MSLDKFTEMYLDWVNNFVSVSAFAAHYGLSRTTAEEIIQAGRLVGHINLER